jgi:hypothetical protein
MNLDLKKLQNLSFTRYDEFIRIKNLNKDLTDGNLWQPFRLPKIKNKNSDYEFLLLKMRILETKTLHLLLFNLLYKHFYERFNLIKIV